MTDNSNKIAAELEQIRNAHGGLLRPADVVAFAADADTALHGRFTWDDSRAAESYRLEQARHIIRVFVTVIPGTNAPIRAYVSLRDDRKLPGGGYRTIATVSKDDERRDAMLADMLADARRFMAKYRHVKEAAEVIAAMRRVSAKVGRAMAMAS